jgi:hypothetical protein
MDRSLETGWKMDPIERRGVAVSGGLLLAYFAIIAVSADIPWPRAGMLFLSILLPTLSLWLMLGVIGIVALLAREAWRGPTAPPHVFLTGLARTRWRQDRFFSLGWPVILYSVLLTLFGLFKQIVLPAAGFRFDPLLHAADVALFGTEPWRFSHGHPWLTEILGHLYYGWYAPMMLGTMACGFLVQRPHFRQRYLAAFVLTWLIVGSLMAFLLPAAGPCFWGEFVPGPNPYAELMADLRAEVAVGMFNPALDIQAYLLASYRSGEISIGGGISALPSMHVALATLFACGAWSLNRIAGIAFALFAFAIWWASFHLGWHYAVDGLVAAPVAFLIWRFAGRLFPESVSQAEAPRPALAPAVAQTG